MGWLTLATVHRGDPCRLSPKHSPVVSADFDGRHLDGRTATASPCVNTFDEGASQDACMIAITGRTDLGADAFAFFDGYLHKPIMWPALKQALEMWSVIEPASDDAPVPPHQP
jgi:hypothetical protein